MTTDILMVTLSKLAPGRKNARKTKPAMSIGELAAPAYSDIRRYMAEATAARRRHAAQRPARRRPAPMAPHSDAERD